jgi:hypothetical protein
MNKLGLVAGIACLILSAFYDWQLVIILTLFFIALKSDIVILLESKFDVFIKQLIDSQK